MQIVVIESEGAKRTHFWLKVGYKDWVHWVYNLRDVNLLVEGTAERNLPFVCLASLPSLHLAVLT
jgi:hypothetical protein